MGEPSHDDIKARAVAIRLRRARSTLLISAAVSAVIDIAVRGGVCGPGGHGANILLFALWAGAVYLGFRRSIKRAHRDSFAWRRWSPWLLPYWIGAAALISLLAVTAPGRCG